MPGKCLAFCSGVPASIRIGPKKFNPCGNGGGGGGSIQLSAAGGLSVGSAAAILANGGGVTVSYFEWTQNRFGYYYHEEEINKRADRSMVRAFQNVWETSKKYDVSMRIAAYIFALQKVAVAVKSRGHF